MKKSIVFVLIFCSVSLLSLQSARAFFLDPSVFYQSGTSQLSSSLAQYDGINGTVGGTGFGLKAGMSFLVPFFGVDLMFSQPNYTFDGSTLPEGNGNSVWAGFTAGAKLPVTGLRAWASYFPYGAMSIGEDLVLANGSAVKFGAGFSVLPMVSLNAEYMMQSFAEVDDKSGSGNLPSADFSNNTVILSLSVPL